MVTATDKQSAFNEAQYEVINMLSCLGDEADFRALKSVLVKFIDSRMQRELDKLYANGELSDAKLENLSHQHLRTPYKDRV